MIAPNRTEQNRTEQYRTSRDRERERHLDPHSHVACCGRRSCGGGVCLGPRCGARARLVGRVLVRTLVFSSPQRPFSRMFRLTRNLHIHIHGLDWLRTRLCCLTRFCLLVTRLLCARCRRLHVVYVRLAITRSVIWRGEHSSERLSPLRRVMCSLSSRYNECALAMDFMLVVVGCGVGVRWRESAIRFRGPKDRRQSVVRFKNQWIFD